MIVADASLMIAWLLNEDSVVVGENVYKMLADNTLLVPAHWSVEVASALAVNLRRGRIAPELLDVMQEQLAKLVTVVQPAVSPAEIAALVRFASDQHLTTYDACYVQLAQRSGAALATLDGEMRAAAKRLNIDVLPA